MLKTSVDSAIGIDKYQDEEPDIQELHLFGVSITYQNQSIFPF